MLEVASTLLGFHRCDVRLVFRDGAGIDYLKFSPMRCLAWT